MLNAQQGALRAGSKFKSFRSTWRGSAPSRLAHVRWRLLQCSDLKAAVSAAQQRTATNHNAVNPGKDTNCALNGVTHTQTASAE